MSKRSAESLLATLLTNLDKGIVGLDEKKPAKKKKEKTLLQESQHTYRLSKATLESKRIILISHVTTCTGCGKTYVSPNKYPLVEKEDVHGNIHRTRLLLPSEAKELPRVSETCRHESPWCVECIDEAVLPCDTSDEAKHTEVLDLDALVNSIFGEKK